MLKIGITGGIGSGKTSVCKVFEWYSIPIFNTDEQTKELYKRKDIKEKVINILGKDSYSDNLPNRQYIAKVIFNNDVLKKRLIDILYPEIWKKLENWYSYYNHKPYCVVETALLFENNLQTKFDKTILVYTEFEERIKRAMRRDQCSREDVLARIKSTMSEEAKINLADFVIFNGESKKTDIYEQIDEIHKQLINI